MNAAVQFDHQLQRVATEVGDIGPKRNLPPKPQTLELAMATALDRRDDAGIVMLNRVLDGVSKRTHRWLEEHRLSCSAGQRSVAVAVNAIGNVTINGER